MNYIAFKLAFPPRPVFALFWERSEEKVENQYPEECIVHSSSNIHASLLRSLAVFGSSVQTGVLVSSLSSICSPELCANLLQTITQNISFKII